MGGNALVHGSVRLTQRNARRMAEACILTLKGLYPAARAVFLEGYRTKPSAGDADILVEACAQWDPQAVAAALGAVEVVRNGPVTSLGLVVRPEVPSVAGNVFQVDLVRVPGAAFDYAKGYFMWSDLGNFIGRIAHAAFTAHRHDGLYWYARDGDYLLREILLTQDHDQALAYLGYDARRFNQGFDTLEDIFEFAASSEFFNPALYALSGRSARARVRDKKRLVYNGFLKWCEAKPDLRKFAYPADKQVWLPRIAEHFPHFPAEHERAQRDMRELRRARAAFNGELVHHITGLEGRQLGEIIRRIKESFGSSEALREFVLQSTPAQIEARVRQAHAELMAG
jgi:hypothetical protein